jgi:signal peptidase II
MQIKERALYILMILAGTVISDQVTKKIAQEYLQNSKTISFFHNLFVLTYAENTGGFLGMGATVNEEVRFWIFSVAVSLFLLAMFFYLIFSKTFSIRQTLMLAMVLGGGIGNLIDRLMYNGRVIDFMNFGIGPLRTGILNMADIYITFGRFFSFWFIISDGKKFKRKRQGKNLKGKWILCLCAQIFKCYQSVTKIRYIFTTESMKKYFKKIKHLCPLWEIKVAGQISLLYLTIHNSNFSNKPPALTRVSLYLL